MLSLSVLLALLLLSPVTASAAAKNPCTGLTACAERPAVDVDGDGRLDRVGVVRVGDDGAADGRFTISVATARGVVARMTRATSRWYGPVLNGYATIDSRKGREIVIGESAGSVTKLYRVLTWRQGRLVLVRDPGGRESSWQTDASNWDTLGWSRTNRDPRGLIRERATNRDLDTGRWTATTTTYQHGPRGWRLLGRTSTAVADDDAYDWIGWRVPGLSVGYPG